MSKSKTKSKKGSKKTLKKQTYVPTFRYIVKTSWQLFTNNKSTFFKLIGIYALFTFVFVQAPSSNTLNDAKQLIFENLPEETENVPLLAGIVIGESASLSEVGALYSAILLIIFSLASIWLLRAMWDKQKVRVKDSFYHGMAGLIPFVIVGFIIFLQLLPFLAGAIIYGIVTVGQITNTFIEDAIFIGILVLLASVSLYFISSSVFALYISALPEIEPIQALKSAKELVDGRRKKILLKIILGLFIYALIGFTVLFISIALVQPLAVWIWWLVGIFGLPIAHTFMYTLYREII